MDIKDLESSLKTAAEIMGLNNHNHIEEAHKAALKATEYLESSHISAVKNFTGSLNHESVALTSLNNVAGSLLLQDSFNRSGPEPLKLLKNIWLNNDHKAINALLSRQSEFYKTEPTALKLLKNTWWNNDYKSIKTLLAQQSEFYRTESIALKSLLDSNIIQSQLDIIKGFDREQLLGAKNYADAFLGQTNGYDRGVVDDIFETLEELEVSEGETGDLERFWGLISTLSPYLLNTIIIPLLVTYIFHLTVSAPESELMEKRINNKINVVSSQIQTKQEASETRIGEQLVVANALLHSILDQMQDNNTYYIVKRQVNLKAKNSNKSEALATLYPNQRLRLIQRDSKWIYVEYLDHLEDIPRMGWVFKKHTKMHK